MGLPLITLQPGGSRPPTNPQKANILAILGASAIGHGHSIAEIVGLVAALGSKLGIAKSPTAPVDIELLWFNTTSNALAVFHAGSWRVLSGVAGQPLAYEGSDPNIPENLTITGISDPVASSPLVLSRGTNVNNAAAWELGDWLVSQQTADWVILHQQSAPPNNVLYEALRYNGAVSPVGIAPWTINSGVGQPVITGDAPIATYLGQWCKSSTAWWQWSGTLWQPIRLLTGEPITTDGTDYFAITHDGSTLGFTPFP